MWLLCCHLTLRSVTELQSKGYFLCALTLVLLSRIQGPHMGEFGPTSGRCEGLKARTRRPT